MYAPRFALPILTTRAGRSPLVGPIKTSRSALGINVKSPGILGGAGLPGRAAACPRSCACDEVWVDIHIATSINRTRSVILVCIISPPTGGDVSGRCRGYQLLRSCLRRLGAWDYTLKPLDYDKLELLLFGISF